MTGLTHSFTMRYSIAVVALAATVLSQSIADLPSCALQCVASGAQSVGCGLTDFKCSCSKAEQLTPAITPCLQKSCPDVNDQAKLTATLQSICAGAGVPIKIPFPSQSSSLAHFTTNGATSKEVPPSSVESSKVAQTKSSVTITRIIADTTLAPSVAVSSSKGAKGSCELVTVTSTVTIGRTSTIAVVPSAPYPTGSASSQIPIQATGTGVFTSTPPLFTGAGIIGKVPAGIAGILGMAALIL